MLLQTLFAIAGHSLAVHAQAQLTDDQPVEAVAVTTELALPRAWYGTWHGQIRGLNEDGTEFDDLFVMLLTVRISGDQSDPSITHLRTKLTILQDGEEFDLNQVIETLGERTKENSIDRSDSSDQKRAANGDESNETAASSDSFRIKRVVDDTGDIRLVHYPYEGQRRDLVGLIPDGRLCLWPESRSSKQRLITYAQEGNHLYWEAIGIPRSDLGSATISYASLKRTD
ncbi:MAG: hypothetical protein AAF937_02355 [Planctomycetota bacterium]